MLAVLQRVREARVEIAALGRDVSCPGQARSFAFGARVRQRS